MPKAAIWLSLGALLWCHSAGAQGKPAPHKVMAVEATAFARVRQVTVAGTDPHEGVVAADPAVLPLGTRIRITGSRGYDGNYLVTDTGSAVKGLHMDLYLLSEVEAKKFGTRTVRVQILKMGTGKTDARKEDATNPPSGPAKK